MKPKNFKYLFVKVYGNKKSLPVKCPLDLQVGIGDYIFINDIEDSWPVCKVSYFEYDPYSMWDMCFNFLGFDTSKQKAVMRNAPAKIYTYEDIKGIIQHKGQKYEGGSTGVCTLKYVRGGDVVNLDPFMYKNIEMSVNNYEFGLYTEHKFGGVIVSENNPHFSFENGVLYDKEKTKIFMYIGEDEELIIPETVKSIKEEAFINAPNLKKIIFKGYVENIEKNAFFKCYDLEQIIFENGVYLFEYANCNFCPKIKRVYCGYNDLAVSKGTLYFDNITVEKGYCYVPCDDNPYYMLYSPMLSYGIEDDEGEHYLYYMFTAPVFDKRPDFKDIDFSKYTPLTEQEYEMFEREINNNVQIINENIIGNNSYLKISYGRDKFLYFGKSFRCVATYDQDLSQAYFKDDVLGYNIILNRLNNIDLLNGIEYYNELELIWRLQHYVKDNHIKAIMKYKWLDDIIPLCETGLMSLEQANILFDFYKNKTSVDNEIKNSLKNYIYRCKVRNIMFRQYKDKLVYLSHKIIDCNYGDLTIAMQDNQVWYMDCINLDTQFAILGINDYDVEEKCKELGIPYCFSSEFAIKNIEIE